MPWEKTYLLEPPIEARRGQPRLPAVIHGHDLMAGKNRFEMSLSLKTQKHTTYYQRGVCACARAF